MLQFHPDYTNTLRYTICIKRQQTDTVIIVDPSDLMVEFTGKPKHLLSRKTFEKKTGTPHRGFCRYATGTINVKYVQTHLL